MQAVFITRTAYIVLLRFVNRKFIVIFATTDN